MSDPSTEFHTRFGGIARLYGSASLEAFREAHVAVVGIGGVGSWVAEALIRSGVGSLTLVDLDDICLTNVNRQVHSLQQSIGKSKISVMGSRLRDINPEVVVHELSAFYTESTAESFFSVPYSFIVDAIDSVRQKAHLVATARERKIPLVTVGGAGGRVDPTRIKLADLSQSAGDRLLMLVRKKLRGQYRFPRVGKGKFKVPCVYSDEPPRFPRPDGSVCHDRDEEATGGLNCDAGLGSATHITASMGFFAASCVLEGLKARDS